MAMSFAEAGRRGGIASAAKSTRTDRNAEIIRRAQAGESYAEIGRDHGLTRQTVREIVLRTRKKARRAA